MWEVGTVGGLLGLSVFFGGFSLFLPKGKVFWKIIRFVFFWMSITFALIMMGVVNLIAKDFSTNVSSLISNALIVSIVSASILFVITFAFIIIDLFRLASDSFKKSKDPWLYDEIGESDGGVVYEQDNSY